MDNFQFSQASAGQLKIWTVQLFKIEQNGDKNIF